MEQAAVKALTSAALAAVSEGADVVILSDMTDQGDDDVAYLFFCSVVF